ncbi:hypothetical protein Tco_0469710 [Tanacetum coccineum]
MNRGPKEERPEKGTRIYHAPSETTTKTADRLPIQMSLKDLQTKSLKQVSKMNKQKKSILAQQDPPGVVYELTDSTFDFSAFVLNRLNVQTLTPELLAGPTFELMKGTCRSLTELEYFCEEVYKATTEKLDWINPEDRHIPYCDSHYR